MTKHKPSEYINIRRWGQMIGSFNYYIEDRQADAAREGAPLEATHKSAGTWQVFNPQTANRESMAYQYWKERGWL